MKIILLGLLVAVICHASLGLETKYLPPIQSDFLLQSLDEYNNYGNPEEALPAHTLDEDGYRYKVGNLARRRRAALTSVNPATFNDLYTDSRRITQDLPDSNFLGPSPDRIAVPASSQQSNDFQGPSPDQIAIPAGRSDRSDDGNLLIAPPVSQQYGQQPATIYQQPATIYQQPATIYQQPAVRTYQQPAVQPYQRQFVQSYRQPALQVYQQPAYQTYQQQVYQQPAVQTYQRQYYQQPVQRQTYQATQPVYQQSVSLPLQQRPYLGAGGYRYRTLGNF